MTVDSSIKAIENYNYSEKLTLKKLLNDYDSIKLKIENFHSEYFENQLQQKKKEINKDLQRIEIMMQKASKENVYLPTLATDILHIIDKYNLYQLSERTS